MPDPAPEKALFVSAGSGITPIMSMLRDLDRRRADTDCVHVHSSRTAEGVIFGEQLERLEARNDRYRVTLRLTGEEERIKPKDLDGPVRVAVTGETTGFSLPETLALLGRDKVLARIEGALPLAQ